jgi:hypothetical protein
MLQESDIPNGFLHPLFSHGPTTAFTPAPRRKTAELETSPWRGTWRLSAGRWSRFGAGDRRSHSRLFLCAPLPRYTSSTRLRRTGPTRQRRTRATTGQGSSLLPPFLAMRALFLHTQTMIEDTTRRVKPPQHGRVALAASLTPPWLPGDTRALLLAAAPSDHIVRER